MNSTFTSKIHLIRENSHCFEVEYSEHRRKLQKYFIEDAKL